jgi:hypothetical protein
LIKTPPLISLLDEPEPVEPPIDTLDYLRDVLGVEVENLDRLDMSTPRAKSAPFDLEILKWKLWHANLPMFRFQGELEVLSMSSASLSLIN